MISDIGKGRLAAKLKQKHLGLRRRSILLQLFNMWCRMSDRRALSEALNELLPNREQYAAATYPGHCVVIAGPGSGKTKTLTTAMARALIEEVADPRGVACITYNNECASELEGRLACFNVIGDDRNFIGTVHSFALNQVLIPTHDVYRVCCRMIFMWRPEMRVARLLKWLTRLDSDQSEILMHGGNLQKRNDAGM